MAHIVFRDPGIAYLVRAVETSVSMPIESDGVALTITSGTGTVYKPDGTSLGQTVATIAAGVPTVALTVGAINDYGAGYRIDWDLVHAGGTLSTYSQPAVLCISVPRPTFGHLDVLAERPTLTDYPGSQTTWAPQLAAAWREFLGDLLELAGHRLDQVMGWEQTWAALRAISYAHIHASRATFAGSSGADARDLARDAYEDAFRAMRLKLDTDNDSLEEQELRGTRIEWPGASGARLS